MIADKVAFEVKEVDLVKIADVAVAAVVIEMVVAAAVAAAK
jgi:hypothetical protein